MGVGGVCIHPDQERILLIQERYKPNGIDIWKFPGGMVDIGETLEDAVAREVLEETGVEAEFVGIFGFRELINFRYGQGDVYFPCLMQCTGNTEIEMQNSELSKCEWIPFKELR